MSAARVELVKDVVKYGAGRIGACLRAALGPRLPGTAGVLVYHRIAERVPGLARPTINVRPRRFRAQIAGLLARGYHVWSLAELLACHERGADPPPRTVVITFDDGFAGIHQHAWPALRELGVPATVFLTTACLDAEVFPFDDWGVRWHGRAPVDACRPLSTAECLEMHDSGVIAFGAHTHTHRNLSRDPEAFEQDLRMSIEFVRERFGLSEVPFAFPWGRPHLGFVSDPLVAAARAAGAATGLTTENRPVDPRTDPFTWGRFNVYDSDTAATIAAKVDGWYGWAPAMQEWWAGSRPRVPAEAAGSAT